MTMDLQTKRNSNFSFSDEEILFQSSFDIPKVM